MENKIEVRPATKDDIGHIFRLICQLADYEKMRDKVTTDEAMLSEALFEQNCAMSLLGLIDGVPAGYAIYFKSFSTFVGRPGIYLEDLYVEPDKRGFGLGKEMLRAVAQIANQMQGRLEWSALSWNAPAIGFYEYLGAVKQSEWNLFRLDQERLECFANPENGL